MTVKEEARTAQFQSIDPESEVGKLTATIYDGMDAMTHAQRSILIRQALQAAHTTTVQIGTHPEGAAGYAMMLAGLLAVAGYAHETTREDEHLTSTADTAVDDVLNAFRKMVSTMAQEGLTDEQRETVETVKARVMKRAEAGEDFETALADEAAKETAAQSGSTAPQTTDSEDARYGMYL